MNPVKKIRYSYWYFIAFIKKNVKFLVISSVSGFLIILFLINFFPYLNSILFKRKEVIGIVGNYSVKTLPIEILNLISNSLVSINEKGELIPLLCSSWESIDQGKIYRITLKKDIYWSDDSSFNSESLKLNLKDVEMTIKSPYVVDFKLKNPLVIFPYYLTKPITKKPLVGIGGQYKVKHLKILKNAIKQIDLIPNNLDLPVKIYKFYPNEDELFNAYKKGDIKYFSTTKKSTADYFSTWKNTTIEKDVDYSKIMVLFINTSKDLLQEKEIRKTVAYSMPAFSDYGQKAIGSIPPTSWAYDSDIKTYSYNLEKAQTFFKKNFTSTQSAQLTLSTFFDYSDIADIIKNELENVGFRINIKLISYISKDYDLLLAIWNPPQDPDQYFFWHSTQKQNNITNVNNIKIDKVLEDGRRILNTKQRKNLYKDFVEAIIDEVPAVFLYYPYKYEVSRK